MSKKISLLFAVFLFSIIFFGNFQSASARIDYEHLNNYNRACYPLCNLTDYKKTVFAKNEKFKNEENQNSNSNNGYSQAGIDPNNQNGNNNNNNGNASNINSNQSGNTNSDGNYYAANMNQGSNRRLATTGIGSYLLTTIVILITSGIIWFIRRKRKERTEILNQTIANISF